MSERENIDEILNEWPYDPDTLSVRIANGIDGREVIQMRVDMGILQLEMEGRPDGTRPQGYETYYDYLVGRTLKETDLELDEDESNEVDREFVQYYHRRICWLRLQNYRQAIDDADHTLALMDFCTEHSSDEQWALSHEQYRPFVLFHRTQAEALAELEDHGPEPAVAVITSGLERMEEFFNEHEAEEHFEEDELVQRLMDLRESLRKEYDVGRTLQQQLDEAIEAEEYEQAAKIRDEIARRETTS